jgi:nucleoside-diphosphate-sugar epimerase
METRAAAFARERDLLTRARTQHADKLLLYFGTCSADDPERRDSPYVAHKLAMESFLEDAGRPWMVLRLPLAIGPGHRGRTLAQYLYDRIARGERFEVWQHATRYPVDVADALRAARHFLAAREFHNRRINVALRAFPVPEFVRIMQDIVGKRALYDLVPKGRHYAIACPEIEAAAGKLELDFSEGYLERVLRKYFGPAGART